MINQQLLEYVRAQRTAGLSKEAIIKAAAAGGWTPADLEEIFLSLDGGPKTATPPMPPPPPPAAQPVQPAARVITPPPQPAVAPQPVVTPRPQMASMPAPLTPLRPMVSPTEVTTAPLSAKKHHIWPYVLSAVLVILAALIFAGYFFVWPTISQMLAPSGQYTSAPQAPETVPLPLSGDISATDAGPADMSASTTASTTLPAGEASSSTASTSAQ